jgi:hypothetical protein
LSLKIFWIDEVAQRDRAGIRLLAAHPTAFGIPSIRHQQSSGRRVLTRTFQVHFRGAEIGRIRAPRRPKSSLAFPRGRRLMDSAAIRLAQGFGSSHASANAGISAASTPVGKNSRLALD